MNKSLEMELSELYTISKAHCFDSPTAMLDAYIEVLRQHQYDLVSVKLPRLLAAKFGSNTIKVRRSRLHFADWFIKSAIEWEAESCAKRIIGLRQERAFNEAEYRPKRRKVSMPCPIENKGGLFSQ